jgi:hypothetical protein
MSLWSLRNRIVKGQADWTNKMNGQKRKKFFKYDLHM